jgi:hypothetical protein
MPQACATPRIAGRAGWAHDSSSRRGELVRRRRAPRLREVIGQATAAAVLTPSVVEILISA